MNIMPKEVDLKQVHMYTHPFNHWIIARTIYPQNSLNWEDLSSKISKAINDNDHDEQK